MTDRPADPPCADLPGADPPPASAWQARLQALREAGLALRDPIGLAAAEALAARLAQQGGALQRALQARLLQRLDALESASSPPVPAGAGPEGQAEPAAPAPGLAALRALNEGLRAAGQGAAGDQGVGVAAGAAVGGLKSVAGFRESWVRLRAETRVSQALGRKPENAGPLNSHMLLLRSLDLMRSLSPDYLRRFVTHVDTLLWLEQAGLKPAGAKAGGRAAAKTTGKTAAKPGSKGNRQGGRKPGAAPARRDPP